jgi:dCMP deaminase
MKQTKIDYYMQVAELTAKQSHAKKLQVGAIAVVNNQIIGEGCNGTPAGWEDNVCEDENGMTFDYVTHAESNLLSKLCRSTISSEGATVFITHSPCMQCSKILAGAGISKIYYKTEYRLTDGIDFLKRRGIEVIKVGSTNDNIDLILENNKRKIIESLGEGIIVKSTDPDNPNLLSLEDEDGPLYFIFEDDYVHFIQNRQIFKVDNMVTYLKYANDEPLLFACETDVEIEEWGSDLNTQTKCKMNMELI